MAANKDLTIVDLSGGYNDTDPPTSLAPHQCVAAENIDFWKAPCGARRMGMAPITLTSSFAAAGVDAITKIFRHFPNTDETDVELWVAGLDTGAEMNLAYKDTSWHDVTLADTPSVTLPYPYQWDMVSLHGKLFIALKTSVDRLHVWDGTSFRRTGLAEPSAAPTAANSGGAGTLSGTRYYRVRETVKSGSTTLLRSEPSSVLTFSPSGANASITITKPATTNTNATHWELEASLDNSLFYILATTAIGTTTVVDTQSSTSGYSAFTLSEDVGDYTTIWSARFLLVDQDRLLWGGSFEDDDFASTVGWSPVYNDPGVGNDERVPVDTDNTLTLDGFQGGGLTGFAGPINGVIYAFKRSHIYRLIRTNQRESAYEPVALSKERGALPGSVVEAVDESGRPALYFLDPKVGPCRLGTGGLYTAGMDINNTWLDVNIGASTVVSRSLFYPNENKIFWWVNTSGGNTPDTILVLQIESTRVLEEGVRYGWSKWTGDIATATSVCLYSDNIEDNTNRSLYLVPFIAIGSEVHMMEQGDDDDGTDYEASLISRPFLASGSINRNFGIRAAAIIGDAEAGAVVKVNLIKDFGVEISEDVDLSLAPAGVEDPVIAIADDLRISESKTIQIMLSDGDANTGQWAVQRIDLIPRSEQSN